MKHLLVIALGLLSSLELFAQSKPDIDWYHTNPKRRNMGISLDKAYSSEFAKLPSKTIIVAVVDGGTDTKHEDLKDVLWTNKGEIPNNGLDDDHNGYIDDVHGWNFIGGPNGENVGPDNMEKVRVYAVLRDKYEGKEVSDEVKESDDYKKYEQLKEEIIPEREKYVSLYDRMNRLLAGMQRIQKSLDNSNPTKEEIQVYGKTQIESEQTEGAIAMMTARLMEMQDVDFIDLMSELKEQVKAMDSRANYHYNPDMDTRKIVQDDYSNSSEKYYGNNDVIGPDAGHGTHVAGIIGATRGNNIGLDGVADNVQIMVVRVVPDGDERDKDVANGIRYAVDNGAKIINMSFGKGFKWDKNIVDSAVAYAESKNVLLVHAAGNNGQNNDNTPNYPNDTLWGGAKFAANWIEIGASERKCKHLATSFSNYGQNNVDLFAPGRDIYSSIPNNEYAYFNGTSMAAPVVSGVAALVWSRYPSLTAVQLKYVLMNSSKKIKGKVVLPGSEDDKERIKFSEICRSSGLVNAYEALKLASKVSTTK